MLTYASIAELLEDIKSKRDLSDFDFVYARVSEWNVNPATTSLYLPSFEESEEWDDARGLPAVIVAQGLSTLLATSNLEDVAWNLLRAKPAGTTDDFVEAIDHYREFDSFKY